MVEGMHFLSYESKKVSTLILSRKMFTDIIPSKSVLGNENWFKWICRVLFLSEILRGCVVHSQ